MISSAVSHHSDARLPVQTMGINSTTTDDAADDLLFSVMLLLQ